MSPSRLALAVIALALTFAPSPPATQSFGPRLPPGQPPSPLPSGPRVVLIPVSTERAIALVRQFGGAAAASRMIDRWEAEPTIDPNSSPFSTDTTSSNWGGFVADTGGSFAHRDSGVKSYFDVQQVLSGPQTGSWIGVGGWGDGRNLIQTGVDQNRLQAFYEVVPDSPNLPHLLFVVNPGDTMWGMILWDASTNLWYLTIQDATLGRYWSAYISFNPDLRTAEWITEVVPTGSVPSFSPVHFSTGYWFDETGAQHVVGDPVATTVWKSILVSPYSRCIYPTFLYGFSYGDTFDDRVQCVP